MEFINQLFFNVLAFFFYFYFIFFKLWDVYYMGKHV